jgi:prepilin-type processing-associated H-X9-DG protein
VVISIISLLLALLMPALNAARRAGQDAQCKANLRSLGIAVKVYAAGNRDAMPPLAYTKKLPARYWWGVNANPPDHSEGLLAAALGDQAGREGSTFECPLQPWGSYEPEGVTNGPTTTYGYNGYYLCPAATPGWSYTIGHRPWQTQRSVRDPANVFMFADTMMSWGDGQVSNNCLLDPPWIYDGNSWQENLATTVCFRHDGHANVCFVDGHVDSVEPTTLTDPEAMVGYAGDSNAPHYVPDWQKWSGR